jgi:rfaE bifunctional protein kinase chain/domain
MNDSEAKSIAAGIRASCPAGGRLVFVFGNFNVVHPGHLRMLNFAASCGDYLVVGVQPDGTVDAHLPEDLRLDGVRSISTVDHALILREPVERFVARLRPEILVKGSEHEGGNNPEQEIVEGYGGKLLFSSGDTRFSLLELLQKELQHAHCSNIAKPLDYPNRHGFSLQNLNAVVGRFPGLKIVVIGDLIVDEYLDCAALGMSQEDPTLVVAPIMHERFVGGAGIVSAHARGLGAQVSYFCVAGKDAIADYAFERLAQYGVTVGHVQDDSRPTTLKQRFRANGKTLLRVSHLREHEITQRLCGRLFKQMEASLEAADLVVFADFNYGCLPQTLVERIVARCQRNGTMMVADSQSSSQIGDVSRFRGMRLLTPTEREARLAMRDFSSGLVVLGESLRKQAQARDVILTLGSEGVLVQSEGSRPDDIVTDQLPALNSQPKDPSGAGDSMLISAAMALAVGADIWQSTYLGSIASACQVARMGNVPLTADELIAELAA